MSLTQKKEVVVEYIHIDGLGGKSHNLVEMEAIAAGDRPRSQLDWYTLDSRVSREQENMLVRELRKELKQREARWAARDRVWPR